MISTVKLSRTIIITVVLIAFSFISAAPVYAAPQLYEHYNASWFDLLGVAHTNWVAQTFTAVSDHRVTAVNLMLKRPASGGDNPGTIHLLIKAADNSGFPTGPALSTGTTNGNTLPKDYPGEWRLFTMSDCTLEQGSIYAVILYNDTGYDSFNWFVENRNPFPGGNALESTNGGTTWITRTTFDMNFEIWGLPPETVNPVQTEDMFMDSSSSAPEYSFAGKSDVKVTRVYTQSSQVLAGNPVIIYSNVANRGDLADQYTAVLKINGKVESTRTGMVQGNVAVPLEFIVYREQPGTYNVDLNGQKTYFTIIENNAQKGPDANGKLPAVILWGILVITVISALLFMVISRNRSY